MQKGELSITNEKRDISATGNRTPAVGVRDRNPNHWTIADLLTFTFFQPALMSRLLLTNMKDSLQKKNHQKERG